MSLTPRSQSAYQFPLLPLQKSFYDVSYDTLHEDHGGKLRSLGTSEALKMSQLTFKESVVVLAANGKVLKKRRLSFDQFITDEDLEAIANDAEEGRGHAP